MLTRYRWSTPPAASTGQNIEDRGAIFWPDIVELRADNPVWEALGLAPRASVSLESGQLLIDKRRHWRPLSFAQALNEEAELLYRMIYGDKDTFLIAWQLANSAFALVPHQPFVDDRCLTQRDFSGTPFTQHRTNAKWSYWGEQYKIEGFQHLEACDAALTRLRERWNGKIFYPPDRSSAARAEEARLAKSGPFLLDVAPDEKMPIDLLSFGEIGGGRASDRQNWWCEEGDGGLFLMIAGPDNVAYQLRRVDLMRWEGTRNRPPKRPVLLTGQVPEMPVPTGSPGLVDELLSAAGFPQATSESTDRALRRVAARLPRRHWCAGAPANAGSRCARNIPAAA